MRFLFLIVFLSVGSGVSAEATTFRVFDQAGKPVANAVITVDADATHIMGAGQKYSMRQENTAFDPFVLIVPKGVDVAFPNFDKFRHHVYSFSRGNRFELELYGKEQERSVSFNKVGVAAIGCNIHDQMMAFIKIVDKVVAGKTDDQGLVTLVLPAGASVAKVWHPFIEKRREVPFDIRQSGTDDVVAVGIVLN